MASNACTVRHSVGGVILSTAFALACAVQPPPYHVAPPAPGPELMLRVSEAGSMPENALDGVLVTAVTDSGEEVLVGKTFGGIVRLNKQDLRAKHARVLLLCAQPFFQCVALRIADQRLYDFDEYWVDLPRVVLR